MSGIRVEHICKAFKDFKAVDDVSFDVKQGELAALLGPSGSGKSTILRIISGLERPDSGEIFLAGQEVTRQSVRKRKIGFVFQHYALFKHMTVEQNIAFGLQVQKKGKSEIKKKVAELIDLVKLNGYDNHFPSQLSGGQQQRVALARALAPEPTVLLLDEPFGSLDAKVRKNLAQWIRDLHKRIHVTGIFVTHDQNEAMEIADKIILINRGRVEQIGSPHEIYETPASKFVASFVGNVNVIEAYIEKGNVFIKGANESIVFHQEVEQRQEGEVVLLVRPEDVAIYREACSGKHIPGRINGIHYRGSFYEIDLEVGSSRIKSVINKENFINSAWQPEEEIFVHFKAYKVFEVSEGFHKIHDMLKQLGYIE